MVSNNKKYIRPQSSQRFCGPSRTFRWPNRWNNVSYEFFLYVNGKEIFFSFRINIKFNLPLPVTKDPLKNFTQFIYLSQINQAMTLKSISDVCRVYSSTSMIDPKTSRG
jgi:hypothetical protein